MIQFLTIEDPEEQDDWSPPPYGVPGRILVRVLKDGDDPKHCWLYEVIDYDGDSGVFWINEGVGFSYFFDDIVGLHEEGLFQLTGVSGRYIRGDGYTSDDDEEWEWDEPIKLVPLWRRAFWWVKQSEGELF